MKKQTKDNISLVATVGSFVCVAGGMVIDGLRDSGIKLPNVLESVMQWSSIWLPILALCCGILIGWNAKRWQKAKRIEAKDKEISELQNQVTDLEKTREQLDEALSGKEEMQRRLAEETHWGDVHQFSNMELYLMERIADAEDESGCLLMPYMSKDHSVADHLQELLVTTCDTSDKTQCGWHLLPQWRKFVKRNRDEIDETTKDIRSKREEDEA